MLTAHEFAARAGRQEEKFLRVDEEYTAAVLAEIHARMPQVRELIFHGHKPAQTGTLQVIPALQTLNALQSIGENIRCQADQWMLLDRETRTIEQLAGILKRFETGMVYVPTAGTTAAALAQLIIQQTCGLTSFFQPKTYKDFIALDIFLALGNGYYIVSDKRL